MICPTQAPLQILHAHSVHSVLDAAATVSEYIAYAKSMDLGAMALTEHGYVCGWHEQNVECHKAGIKPIMGNEIYLMPPDDYQFVGKSFKYFHLSLWAMNEVGFRNLSTICTRAWGPERIYKAYGSPKPRVIFEDLELYNEGIICGTGCIEGPVAKPIIRGEINEAYKNMARLNAIFGPDRLYMEVMPHNVMENYAEEAIEVENEHGRKFTFALTDTVDTSEGRMSVVDAMKKGVIEIFDAFPKRSNNGSLEDGWQRKIAKTDGSEYIDDPTSDLLTPPIIRRVAAIPGNDEDYDELPEPCAAAACPV